ncbi:hypothetical protein EV121DRAFT_274248 [Schizophyllum commune]
MSTQFVTTLHPLCTYTMPKGHIDCMAISGNLIAYSANGHTVVFDISRQRPYAIFHPLIPPATLLRARPRVAAIDWCPSRPDEVAWLQVHDRIIRVADVVRSSSCLGVSRGESLKYSPDGNRLAVLLSDFTIAIYRVTNHTQDPHFLGIISTESLNAKLSTLLNFGWLAHDTIMLAQNSGDHTKLRFCEYHIPSDSWQSSLAARTVTPVSGSSYQVTDFDNQAEWHIEDTSMRRCDHSPPLAFFDDGRAVILSKSGHIVVYDLQTNTTCQVLSHSDEDAIVAVRLRGQGGASLSSEETTVGYKIVLYGSDNGPGASMSRIYGPAVGSIVAVILVGIVATGIGMRLFGYV